MCEACINVVLGKDRIIFVTKEDHEAPSNAELIEDDPNDPYEDHGTFLLLIFAFWHNETLPIKITVSLK